ncbi:hypothetical protein [Streptomyces mooreae]|uniref:hypothetical protein n=1 Tax=Streptomyces mooreae TaxID=3075523 RepID=UPI00374E1CD9
MRHWEDDGQDDQNAEVVIGGPNPLSLAEARVRFRARESCDDRCSSFEGDDVADIRGSHQRPCTSTDVCGPPRQDGSRTGTAAQARVLHGSNSGSGFRRFESCLALTRSTASRPGPARSACRNWWPARTLIRFPYVAA